MAQGRRLVRTAATMAIAMCAAGLITAAGPAVAATATERADSLAQARDDSAVAVNQVINEPLATAKDQDWFRYVISRRDRQVVTLGSLPANYSLAVYRADGTRIASSDHAGKGFERVYFTADPGTYYVRVASTKGSSRAPYRLWWHTLTGQLALQSYRVVAVNRGYSFIVAEFVNTTGSWLHVNSVVVNSLAADGRFLQRDAVSLQQWRVAPYGLLHVSSSLGLPIPPGHDHYQLLATGVVAGPASVSALKAKLGSTVTQNGYRVHTGTVTNTGSTARGGDSDLNGPSVDVTYYNANGTVLGAALTNLARMAPGATVKYRVAAQQSTYWYSPFPAPNRYATSLIAAW
jgi:hypothetical protein